MTVFGTLSIVLFLIEHDVLEAGSCLKMEAEPASEASHFVNKIRGWTKSKIEGYDSEQAFSCV
jgi:hypothetical protein